MHSSDKTISMAELTTLVPSFAVIFILWVHSLDQKTEISEFIEWQKIRQLFAQQFKLFRNMSHIFTFRIHHEEMHTCMRKVGYINWIAHQIDVYYSRLHLASVRVLALPLTSP